MSNLQGTTTLVTGPSHGIDRACAAALCRAGARAIVHYVKAQAEADSLAANIRASRGAAEAAGADMAESDGRTQLAAEVKAKL